MDWDLADFVLAGLLLAAVVVSLALALRRTRDRAYRAGAVVALAAAFMLLWGNAAVGLVGAEDNPANRMVVAVVGVGIAGALLARFRPRGMALALVATALAQVALAVIAWIAGWGSAFAISACFVALWLLSAWLFRRAAREEGAR